jgi:hypothetical protein
MASGLLGLFLAVFPAALHAGFCSLICTPSTWCGKACNQGTIGNPNYTTCGEWGVCAGERSSVTKLPSAEVCGVGSELPVQDVKIPAPPER